MYIYLAYSFNLNVFYNILLYFAKPILHNVTLKSLIHRRLSDNPTQKNTPIVFYVPIQNNITIYMYKANITLPYLMCVVEG